MSDTQPVVGVESLSDGVCITLTGEIDLSQSPVVRQQLMQIVADKPERLLVDLSNVSYMDSSGVATLVEALQAQRKNNGRMILYGLQPKVRGIFEVSRLDMVFTIVDDADAARSA
jgi:anti-sigma B factor antagonist